MPGGFWRMTSQEIYREHILDLYKNPHNFGKVENPTHKFQEINPLCGDEIDVSLTIKDGTIEDIKFNGMGCAISMASASLLTDKIKDMKLEDAKKISNEDVIKMLNIPISYVRMKCALL